MLTAGRAGELKLTHTTELSWLRAAVTQTRRNERRRLAQEHSQMRLAETSPAVAAIVAAARSKALTPNIIQR